MEVWGTTWDHRQHCPTRVLTLKRSFRLLDFCSLSDHIDNRFRGCFESSSDLIFYHLQILFFIWTKAYLIIVVTLVLNTGSGSVHLVLRLFLTMHHWDHLLVQLNWFRGTDSQILLVAPHLLLFADTGGYISRLKIINLHNFFVRLELAVCPIKRWSVIVHTRAHRYVILNWDSSRLLLEIFLLLEKTVLLVDYIS